jgi:hypothetical protein
MSQKWKFANEMSFTRKLPRERDTLTNIQELDCGSGNVDIQPQVEHSTEDVTDDGDREATTEWRSARTQPGPETGPGSTDNVRVRIGFGPGSNDSNQTLYRTFRAFSGHSFFANKELFVVALILCS